MNALLSDNKVIIATFLLLAMMNALMMTYVN